MFTTARRSWPALALNAWAFQGKNCSSESPTDSFQPTSSGTLGHEDLTEPYAQKNSLWGLLGGAGAAKTRNVIGWAVAWWLMNPYDSSVTIVSTTKPMLRTRAWSEVETCYQLVPEPKIGHLVSSEMQWRASKGDAKHAIIGRAVDEGAIDKIAADIKGHHTKRQMIVIDEATAVKPAIWDAAFNLWFGSEDFMMIAVCNLNSWVHSAGKFFEPVKGVKSLQADTYEWETKPQYGNQTGVAVRFDALESPNITEGRVISPYLPTQEKVDAAIAKYGGDKSPLFWENVRGIPAPEGTIATVFNESTLIAGNAFGDPFHFESEPVVVGGFDPNGSFGGDKPAIRFALCGTIEDGGQGVVLLEPLEVSLDAASPVPHTYQLARGAIALCEQYKCPVSNLAVDCSGNNSGVADVIQQEKGDVIRIDFHSIASNDRQVSAEDPTLCSEKYRDKVTELWFTAALFFASGQVRGLDKETASDLVQRCWFGGSGSQKIWLEPKRRKPGDPRSSAGYKERIGHSPDDADCLTLTLEAARRIGIQIRRLGRTAEVAPNWKRISDNYAAVTEHVDYQPESPASENVEDWEAAYADMPQTAFERSIFGG